jgi:hypothetical protein
MAQSKPTLDYIIYVKSDANADPDGLVMRALSADLSEQDANLWRGLVTLNARPGFIGRESESVGVFKGPEEDYILARAYHPEDVEPVTTVHQYILIPAKTLQNLSSNIPRLLEQIGRPSLPSAGETILPSLDLMAPPTWTLDERLSILKKLLKRHDMETLFVLLGAALSQRRLLVRGYDDSLAERLMLTWGLMLLLPIPARPYLTFATYVQTAKNLKGRVVFSESSEENNRWLADFNTDTLPPLDAAETPYLNLLRGFWQGDLDVFAMQLRELEINARTLMVEKSMQEGLQAIFDRHQLDKQVTGEVSDISIDAIKAVLTGDTRPEGTLQDHYIDRLVQYALTEREAEAVAIITGYMEDDAATESRVLAELRGALEGVPDDVYFFIRTYLANGIEEQWLPLLHDAAEIALQRAIDDDDPGTIITWLNLIAREPAAYQMRDVLRQGITQAQVKAREHGRLGSGLLVFAAKRTSELIDSLLNDEALVTAVAAPLGPALRAFDPEAFIEVMETNRDAALLVGGQAVQRAPDDPDAAALFTSDTIDYLWALYFEGHGEYLPQDYQPETIINRLIAGAGAWLPLPTHETLYTRIVNDGVDDMLKKLAGQLENEERQSALLVDAFRNSATPAEEVIVRCEMLYDNDLLNRQQLVDIFLTLAANRDWDTTTRPLIEWVTRHIQQDQTLQVTLDSLWQMLRHASGEDKLDAVAGVATRHILTDIEQIQDDRELIEMLARLHNYLTWSKTLRTYIINWWRGFVQAQPLARLQQIDRVMQKRKDLRDEYAIIQTTIAVRRMLSNRDLMDFAAAVKATFNLLQSISESFDPLEKQTLQFDPVTVRTEMDKHGASLTPDQGRVLAKNLRELAQLIISMSESRSRPNIMRRDEDVERQLISGDQQPQSAIDIMRWLSGYLNGYQQGKIDETE